MLGRGVGKSLYCGLYSVLSVRVRIRVSAVLYMVAQKSREHHDHYVIEVRQPHCLYSGVLYVQWHATQCCAVHCVVYSGVGRDDPCS